MAGIFKKITWKCLIKSRLTVSGYFLLVNENGSEILQCLIFLDCAVCGVQQDDILGR